MAVAAVPHKGGTGLQSHVRINESVARWWLHGGDVGGCVWCSMPKGSLQPDVIFGEDLNLVLFFF